MVREGQEMKTFKELYLEAKAIKKVMSKSARKAAGRRMAKMAKSGGFQMKKKKAELRMRDAGKLMKSAKTKAMNQYRPDDYKDKTPEQRAVIDQKIQTNFGKKVDKVSKGIFKKLKKGETARVKAARDALKGDN